jgi:glyoxylase-like metal-dependent hydrolase (beta-lactamase superfamily II)
VLPMRMRVGDIEVTPLSDGTFKMPQQYFGGADWSAHQALLGPDGTMELPIGCFLVRTGDTIVLVDAGIGPVDVGWLVGGNLPAALAAAGVRPADIDVVVCTHLHMDHAGWLVRDGAPYFPNATVRFGRGDWQRWVADAKEGDHIRDAMLLLDAQQRLEAIDDDGVTIAPGVTTRSAPGHTLGHQILVVSSGDERLLLLGDAVTCPVQLEEEDWAAISDMDPALSRRTRDALWAELEGTTTPFTAGHFPGLQFGRALRGAGKRYFAGS